MSAVAFHEARGLASVQTPAPMPSGSISGAVTDRLEGGPVVDAIVSVVSASGPSGTRRRIFTDSSGRFVFTGLPVGEYLVTAVKTGYFDSEFGASDWGALAPTSITISSGLWVSDVNLQMMRPSAISGMVLDEHNEPIGGVFVRSLVYRTIAGIRRIVSGPVAVTDDRGVYRIDYLRPGTYVVMVPSGAADSSDAVRAVGSPNGHYPLPPFQEGNKREVYPITFSGNGAVVSHAETIELTAGAERTGVNVELKPVPAVSVTGVVVGTNAERAGVFLRLVPAGLEDLGNGAEMATAAVGPDGLFTFDDVPAGSYTLTTQPTISQYRQIGFELEDSYGIRLPRPANVRAVAGERVSSGPTGTMLETSYSGGSLAWVTLAVDVEDRDKNVGLVPLHPAIRVTGQIVVDRNPNKPAPTGRPSYFSLEPADGNPRLGRPRVTLTKGNPENGSLEEFVVDGALPGLYVFRPSTAGWLVKSVVIDGRNEADGLLDTSRGESFSGIRLTLTNSGGTLEGTVRMPSPSTRGRISVIAFPFDQTQWSKQGPSPAKIRVVPVSTDGNFRVEALPAGEFRVIAVRADWADRFQESEFLAWATSRASRITITWGETTTLALALVEAR
ncbi:MAG TPA: carboxypeptidase-like regulatory domain-containing protein [Vicinamibacterales bacterium]|nr:carboxypeptidase-like regulatory domain-containing protein [Vicinamibacterales bacterium]